MSSQYGELRPTSGWDRFVSLWQFQRVLCLGFITAATSLNGSRPNFARCLAVSWAGTLYLHFPGLLPRNRILPGIKFSLRQSLALYYITHVAARHSSSDHQPNCGMVQGMKLQNFRWGCHLYSAGRPSRLASTHTLVVCLICQSTL